MKPIASGGKETRRWAGQCELDGESCFGPPYDVYTPDEFFCLISENDPDAVRAVAAMQVEYWLRRAEVAGTEPKRLAAALTEAGCPNFAQRVNECLMVMSGHRDVTI